MSKIVILGNGIAGITAARHIRKRSDDEILIISGETEHFFSRTALMYIYMGHMKYENTKPYEDWFWGKNKIELLKTWITEIDFENKLLKSEKGNIEYEKLIIATGSKSNKFGWPGQELEGVQGLYSIQDLESLELKTPQIETAVVVGGGLIGIELAEMLHSRNKKVVYLVRDKRFWEMVITENEAEMIEKHIRENGIDLRMETELEEIVDDGTGHVKAIKTKSGEIINCEFVGLTVGVSPNIDLFKSTKLETDKGILVNNFLETNIRDVYAIGDCAQVKNPKSNRRPIEAVWYVGRMMGEIVALNITGNSTEYEPGVWFNSAKFFDIEYQTYGNVEPIPKEGIRHFYWKAEKENKSITIAYDLQSFEVKGINTFGIRMKHEIWERWLKEKKDLSFIVKNLKQANFDPEFYKQYDIPIQKLFNETFPDQKIKPRTKSLLEKLLT